MKLALDVWYEAWGRVGGYDAEKAGSGEATGAAEPSVRGGDLGDRLWWEDVGDHGPPPCAVP